MRKKRKKDTKSTLISGLFLLLKISLWDCFAYQYKKIDDSLMEFGFRIDDVEAKADSIHEIEEFGNCHYSWRGPCRGRSH